MKKFTFTVLIEKDEDGGYVASAPELKGCHTQGEYGRTYGKCKGSNRIMLGSAK